MSDESQQLMERIAALSDKDLLRMVSVDHTQYQSEAITYAKAEISKRGVDTNQVDLCDLSDTAISHPLIIWIKRAAQYSLMVIRTRAFELGFFAGGFVFLLLNIRSYRQMIETSGCCDHIMSFGFPLEWYSFGGYIGMTYIHWWKIVVNIMAGIFMCLLSGWLFKRVVGKILFYLEPA